jgi:uncharacterized alpha-E superfamily protein
VLTYRGRYLSVLQPAPVLDLILADEGNPRGLVFQLISARATLEELAGQEGAALSLMLAQAIAETRAIVTDVVADGEGASEVPARLRRIGGQIAALSDATGRTYFALLPVTWAESVV